MHNFDILKVAFLIGALTLGACNRKDVDSLGILHREWKFVGSKCSNEQLNIKSVPGLGIVDRNLMLRNGWFKESWAFSQNKCQVVLSGIYSISGKTLSLKTSSAAGAEKAEKDCGVVFIKKNDIRQYTVVKKDNKLELHFVSKKSEKSEKSSCGEGNTHVEVFE